MRIREQGRHEGRFMGEAVIIDCREVVEIGFETD